MEITLQEKGLGIKMITCKFCNSDYKSSSTERAQYHGLGICGAISTQLAQSKR